MMFARIFDKESGLFYKSILYGEMYMESCIRYIVYSPEKEAFVLVDYIDNERPNKRVPLVERINSDRSECVTYDKVYVLKLNRFFKNNGFNLCIDQYCGYDEVYQDFDFMLRISRDRIVQKRDCSIQIREPKDAGQWTYIKTQNDADVFFSAFAGFHDSTLDRIQYAEDDGERRITATFDNSGWYGVAELCFEGLIAINLRPAQENFTRDILSACLLVENECVFWADANLDKEDLQYEGSFIKALNLKWRKIG